ncbi:hypothetical protein [Streptomyces europaeiscabiei]|uniref:hypothetical protein n=1 Tax=Streptomyces europaeiscabiei TaxID=146819 RepID=UPI0038F67DBB
MGRFALLVADRGPKNRDDLQLIMTKLASGQLAFVNAARRSCGGEQSALPALL